MRNFRLLVAAGSLLFIGLCGPAPAQPRERAPEIILPTVYEPCKLTPVVEHVTPAVAARNYPARVRLAAATSFVLAGAAIHIYLSHVA